jgi:hypothetical protein
MTYPLVKLLTLVALVQGTLGIELELTAENNLQACTILISSFDVSSIGYSR